jgi:DNA-directed RNA polymerase subunit RPC12/RpoP
VQDDNMHDPSRDGSTPPIPSTTVQDEHRDELSQDDTAPPIIHIDLDAVGGQSKCPRCGSTDISLNSNTGLLRCNFCRYEFESEKVNEQIADIYDLKEEIIGSGASDIIADTEDILTFKCSSCGAEVVIDTNEAPQARCHWCRNTLSINQQIPNGSIPDMVLPFKLTKSQAQTEIEAFVSKRKFFAHPKFKKEFCTNNIMGVYLPYMVIDMNAHANFAGQGERFVRSYTRGSGKTKNTYYDADLYEVEREFDLIIDDLTIESSTDKLQHGADDKTTNVINAILPFDTENCVKWDANFLRGYTSEKRDTNISQLQDFVYTQAKDIARHKANDVLGEYNRGVCWSKEELDMKGSQWKAAYLPIWLYSYQQVKSEKKKILHYVAVNARTKETMGSVPIHLSKLLFVSLLVEIFGVSLAFLFDAEYSWVFALSGVGFYLFFYTQYRSTGARHKHEVETKASISNVRKVDNLIRRLTGLSNSKMRGANNLDVGYKVADNDIVGKLVEQTPISDFLKFK